MVVLAACGPVVATGSDDESTTSITDDGESTTTATTLVTTSPGDGPGTTATTTSATTSTSTSTDTTVTSVGEDSSDEGTFIPEPDPCIAHCTQIECDLWDQDCPEGEKCMPWANDGSHQWNAPRCSPLSEVPGAPGDACLVEGSGSSGIDDCGTSTMCWNVDPDTNVGTCAGFCAGSEANPTCDDGTACFSAYEGAINLCLPTCDPLAPACARGFACVESYAQALTDAFACVPSVLVAERSTYAAACDEIIGCGTGFVCASASDVPGCADECCTTLCDPLGANECPDAASGQVCIPHEATPTLGHCGFA